MRFQAVHTKTWENDRIALSYDLRWPEPIYIVVGYAFNLRFSEWKIQPISMIFGILNNH